ncbi:MAG: DUF2779 domain-containing protein [Rhodothermales bacterium]
MEDYQTPPVPNDRLAIVIIHGIGNQQPLDTLLPFAKNLIEEPANPDEPKFWSQPDRMSESFELRRLTARKSNFRPTTDFYEYYWAHQIPGATYTQILSWARRLLLVNPKRLIPKIRLYWGVSWFFIVLALCLFVLSFFQTGEITLPFVGIEVSKAIFSLILALLIPVVVGFSEHFLLKYVGDAARYLQPDPENVQIRHEIRANGIKLLRDLHAEEDGQQKYSRIVVVGHSLGSVIAYDIIHHLWDEFKDSFLSGHHSILPELERSAKALHDVSASAQVTQEEFNDKKAAYQQLQKIYWREQRERARQENKQAWLVSDLITLGSPLVHAEVLLNTTISSVAERKAFRELPTCPPQMNWDKYADCWRFSYKKWEKKRPTDYFIPDHGAVFGSTVWTNMYFPGDVVGDKLAPILGPGIKDIELRFPPSLSKKHNAPTSHTIYWSAVKKSTDHLSHLREILGFSKILNPTKQDTPVHFTKRTVMLGRQCEKAIWLDQHQSDLKEPASDADLLRFEQGNAVDMEARGTYPGGVEVSAVDWDVALHNTQKHVDAKQHRIYQAAFEHNDVRVRTDILDIHADGSCSLREVKMSTRKRDEHVLDMAIQMYVLNGTNLPVKEAHLVLVDKTFVAGNTATRFQEYDVTEEALAVALEIEANLGDFKDVLKQENVPDINIGPHCTKPWTCAFHAHCWQHMPADSIYTIPRLSAKKKQLLVDQGIVRAKDVPDDFELTDNQAKYVALQKSGKDATDKTAIREILGNLTWPLYFLDFETFSTPMPVWPGTKPNQQVPFQYSNHKLEENGTLSHHAFLHTEFEDPRQQLIESLLATVGDTGTIIVYNDTFEKKVLEGLAEFQPAAAAQLNGMIERLFDQLDLVKNHVAHPGLLGSNSLKRVSDVLIRNRVDYNTLAIKEGSSAQANWYNMTRLPNEERAEVQKALLDYCRLDTLALVELHHWFMR